MKRQDEPVSVPGGPGVAGGTVVKDKTNPTVLTKDPRQPGPFLHPNVSDPVAINYAKGAETRRRPGVVMPRYAQPVAGGPDVRIPLLSEQATNGTMEQQALSQRASNVPSLDSVLSAVGAEPALNRGKTLPTPGIVTGSAHVRTPSPQQQPTTPGVGTSLPAGILRDDTLPEQATQDPAFMSGPGAMFAASQPHLALKYGVMRKSVQGAPAQYISPQQLQPRPKGAVLRPETLDGLQAVTKLQEQRAQSEKGVPTDEQVARETANGPAGGAGVPEEPMSEGEKKRLIETLNNMDEFDISRVKRSMFKDTLNNEEQRRIVEARLTPLDLTELIMNGRVIQKVPVIPDVFEPVFQSYSGDEDLHVKRLIGEEARTLAPSDRYIIDKYQLMGLTIAVRAINNWQFPDYVDEKGDFDDTKFWAKYAIVSRLNYHMMASLMVNWFWFDMRVRRLFKTEELGNG